MVAEEPTANSSVAADSQPGVSLLAADSLAGWNGGRGKLEGWTIKDGKLTGGAKSTPLVSGLTLGDFELHAEWKVADGGAIKLGFPTMPEGTPGGKGIEIRLAEQPGISVRLPQGAKSLKVDPLLFGKLHQTMIKRVGNQLVLVCDSTKSRELPVSADDRFGLTLAIVAAAGTGTGTIESLRLVEHVAAQPTKP